MKPDTLIRWAVHPSDQQRILQLPGVSDTTLVNPEIPKVGDRFTHPLLVDPRSRVPCEVRVAQVLHDYAPGCIVVVLTRDQ